MILDDLEALDIPPEMILAVAKSSARLETFRAWVRSSFRDLAETAHPDAGGSHDDFVRLAGARGRVLRASFRELAGAARVIELRQKEARARAMKAQVEELIGTVCPVCDGRGQDWGYSCPPCRGIGRVRP